MNLICVHGLGQKSTSSMLKLNFSGKLRTISCPTAIVCGTKDYANKRAAKVTADYISEASTYFIDGAGHEVNVRAPKKLAEVLNAFYKHD